ncbi:MAG: sulfite exporter TauE/SafE family protein, partial [Anaerolineae bacterium]|nr:sulfite exporter TauE/SafE family protein [Anaerolineae bacterium]
HYNPSVLQTALMGLPVMLVGLVVGWSLDRYINPETFRKLVLVLLVLIGLRLILVNIQG